MFGARFVAFGVVLAGLVGVYIVVEIGMISVIFSIYLFIYLFGYESLKEGVAFCHSDLCVWRSFDRFDTSG